MVQLGTHTEMPSLQDIFSFPVSLFSHSATAKIEMTRHGCVRVWGEVPSANLCLGFLLSHSLTQALKQYTTQKWAINILDACIICVIAPILCTQHTRDFLKGVLLAHAEKTLEKEISTFSMLLLHIYFVFTRGVLGSLLYASIKDSVRIVLCCLVLLHCYMLVD